MTKQLGYIWIVLIVISELILLILPVYIYDKNLLIILLIGCFIQMWFFQRFKKDFLRITKSIGLGLIPFVFAIFNLTSYMNRSDNAFNNSPIDKTEATIIERYSQGGGRTSTRYYLVYRFRVNSQIFEHVDEVKYWVWFYYKSHDKLVVDYVIKNPKISRINEASLIEQPNKDEIIKKAGEEYNRQRLEKKRRGKSD